MSTFTKSSGIDDTMMRLLDMGMPVKGALDGRHGAQDWAPVKDLKTAGAKLFAVPNGNGVGKLHHMLMVLDEQVIIAGSFIYWAGQSPQ